MELMGYLIKITVYLLANPLLGIFIYIVPTALAYILRKENLQPIAILNIVLGWMAPAWIAIFLWSLFGVSRRPLTDEEKKDNYWDWGVKWSKPNKCQKCNTLILKSDSGCYKCDQKNS